jgi:hypothetical protein
MQQTDIMPHGSGAILAHNFREREELALNWVIQVSPKSIDAVSIAIRRIVLF